VADAVIEARIAVIEAELTWRLCPIPRQWAMLRRSFRTPEETV
jgi:hypothetical protein